LRASKRRIREVENGPLVLMVSPWLCSCWIPSLAFASPRSSISFMDFIALIRRKPVPDGQLYRKRETCNKTRPLPSYTIRRRYPLHPCHNPYSPIHQKTSDENKPRTTSSTENTRHVTKTRPPPPPNIRQRFPASLPAIRITFGDNYNSRSNNRQATSETRSESSVTE
jgi:hypothetical protein